MRGDELTVGICASSSEANHPGSTLTIRPGPGLSRIALVSPLQRKIDHWLFTLRKRIGWDTPGGGVRGVRESGRIYTFKLTETAGVSTTTSYGRKLVIIRKLVGSISKLIYFLISSFTRVLAPFHCCGFLEPHIYICICTCIYIYTM